MEKRLGKVTISAAGGTAGKGAKTYKLTIPSTWIAAMGITEDGREVELTFDGEKIVVARPLDMSQFAWRSYNKDGVFYSFTAVLGNLKKIKKCSSLFSECFV